MHRFTLPLLLLTASLLIPQSSHADCEKAIQGVSWEDITHSHDGFGEHTHTDAYRRVEIPGECELQEYQQDDHTGLEPEPEPEPPLVIKGYTPPIILTCVAGPCLEEEKPDRLFGPLDIEGNLPPEPDPGEETYYPTVVVDGKAYWDPSREPIRISEAAKNAESPDGYRLEDIDGQLFLVPYGDTLKHTPVDPSEETPQQETFIIYTVVEVVGDKNYLKPTPFHAHPIEDPTEDPLPTDVDPQENPDGEDEESEEHEEGETYASLDGQFYQVTSNPATPLQVTEYMVRHWGDGQDKLPQWIEIYNPNALAVNLAGYEFSYVFKKQTRSITLRHFLIPPGRAIILATHIPLQRWKYEGISESQVYTLNIENGLKQGWSLKDPLGLVISQTGKAFGEKEDPIMPERVGISRVSYNVYASERTRDAYFFGFRKDVSTPGYHEPKIPRSPTLLRQRMKTTWAALKKH